MIGKALSHFEITAKLGEGGMGEVYRTVDTRLGREVAIKVLPEAFTSDPERLARFEREASVLASLNHPNIAALHQIEEAEGQLFLVLELVDGDDLTTRLAGGAIPVEEAIDLGVQIASGLEAAHSRGIVHRDLKLGNIKVTPEGQVKILDFGLAKARVASEEEATHLSQSPTLSVDVTRAGVILGTAGYMSPEQARGEETDQRSDIWSFGVVLYELLTGGRLFAESTASDTLAAVLRAEVDRERLPRETPTRLRRLLRRCLERAPRRRLHAIADARIELEAPEDEPGFVDAMPSEGARRWTKLLAAAIGGALITGAVLLILGGQQGGQESYRPLRYLQVVDGSELRRVAAGGGPSIVLAELDSAYIGGTWGEGDRLVVGLAGRGLVELPARGGEPRVLLAANSEAGGFDFHSPTFLGESEMLAFITHEPIAPVRSIEILVGTERRVVFRAPTASRLTGLAFDASSRILVFATIRSNAGLWALSFDPQGTATEADAQLLIPNGLAPSIAADGSLVYVEGLHVEPARLARVGRAGRMIGEVGQELWDMDRPVASPDGSLVGVIATHSGSREIWVQDLERNTALRVTTQPPLNVPIGWADGGESIVYATGRGGTSQLVT